MKDRLLSGAIAGVAGGIVMDSYAFFSFYVLRTTTRMFLHWTSSIVYGKLPETFFETAFALFAHLLWSGMLGALFAYLVPLVTSRNHLVRGVFFGVGTWFTVYALNWLFKLKSFTLIPAKTAASNLVGGILFGLTVAYVLSRLDHPAGVRDPN